MNVLRLGFLVWLGAVALLIGVYDARAAAADRGTPVGWRLSADAVLKIAEGNRTVAEVRAREPHTFSVVSVRSGERRWQVSMFRPGSRRAHPIDVAQVVVDDVSGRVVEAWTGPQVAWTMARGYPGAFGGAANEPLVWIVLCALFLLPLARAPLRLIHLDFVVLLGFAASYAAFCASWIHLSVPLIYPLLAYLLVRMLWVAGRGRPGLPARLAVPDHWLALLLAFLLTFRVAIALTGGDVIDVGYAGEIGADRLLHGRALYGHFPFDNGHGDTYGVVLYAAYVPWTFALPWTGHWDALPAARATAVSFDLACVLLCWLLGRRLGGPRLGLLLAYLWAAYPFTLMTLASSSSDALVAALVLATLLASARPVARGAAVALAGLTKLAPFFLLPLLAGYGRGLRGALITMVIAVVVTLAVLAPVDPGAFLDRTVLFQAHRASPFSIWGLWGGLAWMRGVVVVGSVALAVAVAVLPRRRDQATLCALAGAVVIAVQLGLEHWFYLYLPWFVPLVCAALLAPREDPAPAISSAAEGPLAQAHLMPAWVRARRRPKPRACSQDVRTAETDR